GGTQPRRLIAGSCRCEIALPEREAALGHPRRARRLPLGDRLWQANTAPFRDYSKATGQLGLESQRRGSEMSQNAGSEEAERHGTRFSALFLGILSTQSRIGPGSRLRCRFPPAGQRRQLPPGVSMTMLGYSKRCRDRSFFARSGSLAFDLLLQRLRNWAQAGPTQCLDS